MCVCNKPRRPTDPDGPTEAYLVSNRSRSNLTRKMNVVEELNRKSQRQPGLALRSTPHRSFSSLRARKRREGWPSWPRHRETPPAATVSGSESEGKGKGGADAYLLAAPSRRKRAGTRRSGCGRPRYAEVPKCRSADVHNITRTNFDWYQ